jgi:DNA-binding transcriptional LysR family regulator
MDLRQLEVFAGVYKLRSFSRTASALHLTQSTVSSRGSARLSTAVRWRSRT